MNKVQALGLEPAGDRSPPDSEPEQLTASDHAMLTLGELRYRRVQASRRRPATGSHPATHRTFDSDLVSNVRSVAHGPILAASV
jgi:hypothetical protein